MRGGGAERSGPGAGLSLALGGGDTGLLRGGGGAALVGIGIGLGAGAGAGAGGWATWFWLLTSRLEGGAGTGAWGLLITLTWFAMLGCGEALGGPGPPPAMAPRGLGGPGPALPVPGSSSLRAGGGPCAEERAPGPIPAPDSDNKAPGVIRVPSGCLNSGAKLLAQVRASDESSLAQTAA